MDRSIKMEENRVMALLNGLFDKQVTELEPVGRGNIKSVYFFNCGGEAYVINFSETGEDGDGKRAYLSDVLAKNDIATNRIIKSGRFNEHHYTITNRIAGETLNHLTEEEMNGLMPVVAESVTGIHLADVRDRKGYGWMDENGDGRYPSWRAFLEGFFAEEQDGYWKNWYDLFENSFLDRAIFDEFYEEMLSLASYCEGQRYLVHGDIHLGNLISRGDRITGIIDWDNVMYGDFIYDIASLQMQVPEYAVVDGFKAYYKAEGIEVPDFDERFRCVTLCRGLDSLRFFAKHGDKGSYDAVLSYLRTMIV